MSLSIATCCCYCSCGCFEDLPSSLTVSFPSILCCCASDSETCAEDLAAVTSLVVNQQCGPCDLDPIITECPAARSSLLFAGAVRGNDLVCPNIAPCGDTATDSPILVARIWAECGCLDGGTRYKRFYVKVGIVSATCCPDSGNCCDATADATTEAGLINSSCSMSWFNGTEPCAYETYCEVAGELNISGTCDPIGAYSGGIEVS